MDCYYIKRHGRKKLTAKKAFKAIKKLYPNALFITAGKTKLYPGANKEYYARVASKYKKQAGLFYEYIPLDDIIRWKEGDFKENNFNWVYPKKYEYLNGHGFYHEKET